MNKQKVCSSTAVVRFQDSDPFNHLNNAKYIDYFMNAREDHILEHYNLDPYKIAVNQGLGWVVASNQIAYLKPAMTMEKVVIESQLFAFNSKHLFVEARMYSEDKTELKAFVWMHFVHFDLKTQKSVEHDTTFMELANDIILPINEKIFEERTKTLMQQNFAMSAA